MKRRVTTSLAIVLGLACFGASASADRLQTFSIAGGVIGPKNGNVVLRYDFTGYEVKSVRMFLAVPNRYLTVATGTSRFSVLKKPVVFHQTGGDVIIKAGTKYWTRTNLPVNYKPSGPHVFIVFKVARNIPHTKQCIRLNAIGTSPATATRPAYSSLSPAGGGYCLGGKQWLKAAAG